MAPWKAPCPLTLQACATPAFRRVRYDVQRESMRTHPLPVRQARLKVSSGTSNRLGCRERVRVGAMISTTSSAMNCT